MSDVLVDNLISTVNRLEQRVAHLEAADPPTRWVFDPFDYGAVADGSSHPLSDYYSTLAEAQEVYTHALALTDEIDWCALQAAINAAEDANGGTVLVNGRFIINRPLLLPPEHVHMMGDSGGQADYVTCYASIRKTSHTTGTHTRTVTYTIDYQVDSIISIDVNATQKLASNIILRGFSIWGPSRTDRCRYGIYAPLIKYSEFTDVRIVWTDLAVFTYYTWLLALRRLRIQYCDVGIWVNWWYSVSTSVLCDCCYVNHFELNGYWFQKSYYSSCVGCACDGEEERGSHTGSNGASTLTDSANTFTDPAGNSVPLVGKAVVNLTDGSWGLVTAYTDHTLSATLAYGTDNDWDTGDEYRVVATRTGTHTGGDAEAALTDEDAAFHDGLIGLYVYNTTDGSYGQITATTETTLTAILAGGTDNAWDNGDEYVVVMLAAGYLAEKSELTVTGGSAEGLWTKLAARDGVGAWSGGALLVYSSAGDAEYNADVTGNSKLLALTPDSSASGTDDDLMIARWQDASGCVDIGGVAGKYHTFSGHQRLGASGLLYTFQGQPSWAENIADNTFEDVLTFTCSGGSYSSDRGICSGVLLLNVNGKTSGGNEEFVSQRWFVSIYKLSTDNLQSDIQQIGSDNAYNNVGYTMTVQEKAGTSATLLTIEAKIQYASNFPSPSDIDMSWSWEFTSQATTATTFITPENAQ